MAKNPGFRKQSTKIQITNELLNKLRMNILKYSLLATRAVKEAYFDFAKAPIASGAMQKATDAKLIAGGKKPRVLFRTTGIPYSKYPFLGQGSSEKYGPRNWLKLGAEKFVDRIK